MKGPAAFLCHHVINNSQARGRNGIFRNHDTKEGIHSGEVRGENDVIRLQIYSVKRGLQF